MSSVVPMYGFGGGGGAALNFKVICNPQPETAKENTIWVDVDRINNYYFSATQPENMTEYDVWFLIGTFSLGAFSATKKNPIMVYPISAKQRINGTLVDKTAKSWQGGEWVGWVTKVSFAKSNWKSFDAYPADQYVDYAAGYAYSNTKFTATISGEWDMVAIASASTYDLTNVNNIKFKATLSKALGDNAFAFVAVSKTQVLYDSSGTLKADAILEFRTKVTSKETPIPVNGLSGKYYILIGIYAWYDNGTTAFTVEDMTLE